MKSRFLANLLIATTTLLMICPIQMGCKSEADSNQSSDGESRYLPKSPRIDKNKPTVVYSENDE